MDKLNPETLTLPADHQYGFPNALLPVLVYRGAVEIKDPETGAQSFEALFARNDWPPAWRYHLYDFHHFHTTAHEALGVFRGHAKARLGGPSGIDIVLEKGDVLVLPAGVGHKSLEASDDFCMVGAYPEGQTPDLKRGDPATLDDALVQTAAVPLPEHAPLGGALASLWGG